MATGAIRRAAGQIERGPLIERVEIQAAMLGLAGHVLGAPILKMLAWRAVHFMLGFADAVDDKAFRVGVHPVNIFV